MRRKLLPASALPLRCAWAGAALAAAQRTCGPLPQRKQPRLPRQLAKPTLGVSAQLAPTTRLGAVDKATAAQTKANAKEAKKAAPATPALPPAAEGRHNTETVGAGGCRARAAAFEFAHGKTRMPVKSTFCSLAEWLARLAPCVNALQSQGCVSKSFTILNDLASVGPRRHERVRGVGNIKQTEALLAVSQRQIYLPPVNLQVYPGDAIGPFALAAVQQATRAEK